MATIQLTQGFVALVDDEDLPLVAPYRWYASCDARRMHWCAQANKPGHDSTIRMHRLLLLAPPGMTVDHIIHPWPAERIIDNRRANLRLASQAQNVANSRKRRKPATSRFKGVVRRRTRWHVRICIGGETTCLGGFATEEDAARAYDEAAVRLFGDFARLNFPQRSRP